MSGKKYNGDQQLYLEIENKLGKILRQIEENLARLERKQIEEKVTSHLESFNPEMELVNLLQNGNILDALNKILSIKNIDDLSIGAIRRLAIKQSAQYQRNLMSDSLRYDVLKRDGFRCKICGRSEQDGVKLHVDHILPISKGGKTELNNLRTLCENCNLGKRDKYDEFGEN